MYDPGKGIFGDVSGSLHNVPMHMQDNGRVAPQIPTMGHVQIHNPAVHMSNSDLQKGITAYSQPIQPGQTGPMGYYQTKIHNAAMYSTLSAEKRAREARDDIQSMRNLSGAAQIGLGLLALTPAAPVAAIASMGLMAADYFMEDSEAYYRGFQNRMSDISGIKNVMQNTGPAMVNRLTGRASENAAIHYLSSMSTIATDIGVTSGDLHGINSMAAQSGLLQGHGGSVGQLSSRLRQVAKLTKQIMDVGAGISAQDAIEIQRLSQEMDIDSSKFNTMDIGRRLIGAAKISGRTVAEMGQVMAAGSAMSSQLGLGGAVGADIALFNDSFVNTSYSTLNAAERRRVGSQAQFASTLNAVHNRFAASISGSLVGQSVFVDPTTGDLRIDDGSAGLFQVGHKATLAANNRFKRIFTGKAGSALGKAGISESYVKSIIGLQSEELAKEAAEGMDPEMRMELMLREAMVESQRLNIDPRAYLIKKHGKAGADALMLQAKKFEDSAASRSLDAYKQNLEYHATVAAADISGLAPVKVSSSERLGRVTATIEARMIERATEEAMGIFRSGGAGSNLGIMDVKVGGALDESRLGTVRRGTLYNAYRGAGNLLDAVKESNSGEFVLSAYRSATSQASNLDESLMGKYLIKRGKEHDRFFDMGTMRGVQTDIMSAFNENFDDSMDYVRVLQIAQQSKGVADGLSMDLRSITDMSSYARNEEFTVAQLLASDKISGRMKTALSNMDPNKKFTASSLAAQRIGMEIVSGDTRAATIYSEASDTDIGAAGLNVSQMNSLNSAVAYFVKNRDSLREDGVGTLSEVKKSLRVMGLDPSNPAVVRAFMAQTKHNAAAKKHMSKVFTDTVGLVDPFTGTPVGAFDVKGVLSQDTAFRSVYEESAVNSLVSRARTGGMDDAAKLGLFKAAEFFGVDYLEDAAAENNIAIKMADLLYETGTDADHIDVDDAQQRLLDLGALSDAVGGAGNLKRIAGTLQALHTSSGGTDKAIRDALNSSDVSVKDKKILRKLQKSGHLTSLKRLIRNKGDLSSGIDTLTRHAGSVKQLRALENTLESLEGTGFGGIFGGTVKDANKVIANLGEVKLAHQAFEVYNGGNLDVDGALAKFGLNMDKLGEDQQNQVRKLFEDTIGAGGGSTEELNSFRKQLFQILSAAGKTGGGKSGRRTAEDSTMETIRNFNGMISAASTLLVALTKTGDEAVADLKTAQQRLQELAAKAQVT